MLVDTGAQISLINNKIIQDQSKINRNNKIIISSLHGSEKTLGNISTKIRKDNTTIPIKLQVTNNEFLKEDGILGYDIIGDKAIVDGPNKKLTINSEYSAVDFPIRTNDNITNINLIQTPEEIQDLYQINYVTNEEIHPHYKANLQLVRSITEEISETKIKIKPWQITAGRNYSKKLT